MRKRNWTLAVLGAASAASVVGLVWLAGRFGGDDARWLSAAAASPLALRCLLIVVGGLVALAAVAALLVRLGPGRRARRIARLHGDQGGTSAVEMTLLFPVAVMVLLIIAQAALLFNANMVVHYSGFAAARVASVVVPLEVGGERINLVYNPDVADNPPSDKLELIRRAAVLALVPVAGRADSTTMGYSRAGGDVVEGRTRSAYDSLKEGRMLEEAEEEGADWAARMAGLYEDEAPWWFERVREQYNYANEFTEVELAKPWHWRDDGNPDDDCPYRHHRRDAWTQWGWTYVSFCPYHEDYMDYAWWEELVVKVEFRFPLQVPYAGRLLRDPGAEMRLDGEKVHYTLVRLLGKLSNEGGRELRPEDVEESEVDEGLDWQSGWDHDWGTGGVAR